MSCVGPGCVIVGQGKGGLAFLCHLSVRAMLGHVNGKKGGEGGVLIMLNK